eukprot:scaffold3526_cov115-Cylindrotheca_fusiformis.AAC.11
MIPSRAMIRLTIFLLFICAHTVSSSRALYYNNYLQMPTQHQALASRSRRSRLSRDSAAAVLVARKTPKMTTFDGGKAAEGATHIAVTTLQEFASGFVTAFVAAFLFRPVEKCAKQPLMTELKGRLGRMNSPSLAWALNWGGVCATMGGVKAGVGLLRNGKEDGWTELLASAAAGAFLARADGPPGMMLKGALMYGGAIYLLSTIISCIKLGDGGATKARIWVKLHSRQ